MKKIFVILAAVAALVLIGAPSANAEEPPFEGVEKYTPSYSTTCESATFSHPAIKTGLETANVYGIRYGATQAEAQAKAFDLYTPGEIVTYVFTDSYVNNAFYFEVKVGFDGMNLKQQIGQTRGVSEACVEPEPEIPAKPDVWRAYEVYTQEPTCYMPLDGWGFALTQERESSHDWLWNGAEWVPDETVQGPWLTKHKEVFRTSDCNPAVEKPVKTEPVVSTPNNAMATGSDVGELAVTGNPVKYVLWAFAGGLLGIAVVILVLSIRK